MSPQRTLSQRSLHRLEAQLAERRRSAVAMSEAFFTDAVHDLVFRLQEPVPATGPTARSFDRQSPDVNVTYSSAIDGRTT